MQNTNEKLDLWRVYCESPTGPDSDYVVIDVIARDKTHALHVAADIADDGPVLHDGGYKSFSAVPLTVEDQPYAN
jgi:hypothetical protein